MDKLRYFDETFKDLEELKSKAIAEGKKRAERKAKRQARQEPEDKGTEESKE